MPQDDRGKAGQAPGLAKTHTITRVNPDTGETETREVSQEEWREQGRQLRAEGWQRPDDDEADDAPEEGAE